MEPIRGLIAAPFTPIAPDGTIDKSKIPMLARAFVADGVSGVFVGGTTGEGLSLGDEQRTELTNLWREAIRQGGLSLRLIVHVGHLNLVSAHSLARHAQTAGADAIACLAPFFFKPNSAAEVVDWCARVAEAAPETPFLFYHLPSMTGVSLKMTEFIPLAMEKIPTFAGVKFTHTDFEDYGETLRLYGDRLSLLSGPDEMLLDALRLGATGAVGTSYNFAAPLFLRLMDAYCRGDEATALVEQERARQYIKIWSRLGVVRTGKAIMQMVGRDCGPVLPPLTPLTAGETSSLQSELEAIGFFDWRQ